MIVPDRCPVCMSEWSGGAALPGAFLEEDVRVFYGCGCRLWYRLRTDNLAQSVMLCITNCPSLSPARGSSVSLETIVTHFMEDL